MLRESIIELSNMLHQEYPNLSGGSKLDSGLAGKTIDRLTTDPELKNDASSDRPQDRADVKTKINETGYIHFCNAPKSTDEVVIKNRAKTKCENLIMKLGANGFIVYSQESGTSNIQSFPALSVNPVDVVSSDMSVKFRPILSEFVETVPDKVSKSV